MRGRLKQMQLLLLGVPVSADALEDAGAVVQGMSHQPELDVVVAPELSVEVDPRVGMGCRLLRRCLGFRLHTHLGLSVSRTRAGAHQVLSEHASP